MDGFISGKDRSMLVVALLVQMKARDPFCISKEDELVLDPEVGKKIASGLAIVEAKTGLNQFKRSSPPR